MTIPTITILLFAITLYLIFKPKKSNPIIKSCSPGWQKILFSKVRFYQTLSATDQKEFERQILGFLNNHKITGIEIEVTDEDKLLVASSAIIPVFHFLDWVYINLDEVLLYSSSFNESFETSVEKRNILGQVGWGVMNRKMILSKPALHQGFENEHSKSSVGIHEFVHLIDKTDGTVDGLPEVILQKQYVIPWLKMMHQEIEKIKKGHSDINPYGALNEAEFFSVVSEYFFNQPKLFEKKHPELFSMMDTMFNVQKK